MKRVHPKVVSATAAATAASVVVGYALHLPPDIAGAIVALATFAGGYLTRGHA